MLKLVSSRSASGHPDAVNVDEEVDAVPPQERSGATRKSLVWELVETLLLALLIFVAVRSVVLNYRVDGSSMEPNLHDREMLIVNRREYFHIDLNALAAWIPGVDVKGTREWYLFRPPQRGDVVVFHPPVGGSEPFIKRIIGLPGDEVVIRDGAVYINGKRLEEPYLKGPTLWGGLLEEPMVVQPGHVIVLGDNRNNSSDSRVFGQVSMDQIIGKAWIAYWPPGQMQVLPQPAYAFH